MPEEGEMSLIEERMAAIEGEIDALRTKDFESSKTEYDKQQTALEKLYTAQNKRLEAVENARVQEELAEQAR
jgi:hypothetical protein